jgi:hypothetical protein
MLGRLLRGGSAATGLCKGRYECHHDLRYGGRHRRHACFTTDGPLVPDRHGKGGASRDQARGRRKPRSDDSCSPTTGGGLGVCFGRAYPYRDGCRQASHRFYVKQFLWPSRRAAAVRVFQIALLGSCSADLPVSLNKQTCAAPVGMSQKCQQRTSALPEGWPEVLKC